jgi:60 kDa SS-A/Ro ribonucleoprotein
MSALGLITGENPENEEWVQKVVGNLTSEEKIKKAGIHPFSVLLAKSVYEQGSGIRGKLTFKSNPVVLDALEKAFMLAFKNVVPTGKRYLLALDVSSSMSCSMSGTVLPCYDAEIAMAMFALRTEPVADVVAFRDNITPIPVNKETSWKEFHDMIYYSAFGQTDCSFPMVWAKEQKKEYDVFVVYTDSETYYGNVHPYEAVRQYREASGIKDAKLIVVAFTGTKFTIADPKDPNMLDVVGFDSATPQLISDFVSGRL